jgi:hypothetical protein
MKATLLSCLLGALALIPSVVAQQASSSSTKVAAAADMTKYIGLRHGSSLPDNLKDIGGALVSEVGDSKEYGIGEIHKGKVKMLWFERLTHRDDAGVPFWEVEDILVLPPVRKNQIVVYSTCFLSNKPDREVVAIADYQPDVEFFTRVRRAWRANRKTAKFEEISFKGIKCTNEGYGV